MHHIKKLLSSLKLVSRVPSKAIVQAGAVVIAAASQFGKSQGWPEDSAEAHRLATSIDLIESILSAVSLAAEDLERSTKAESAAKVEEGAE